MMSDRLAILGGQPRFREQLLVGRPNIGDRRKLVELLSDALDRRWLSNSGPFVKELEERLADWLGVRHCIAVANGTLGLEILAKARGVSGQVLMPSYTFVATPHSMDWIGLKPVFCDVDVASHNIDPVEVEASVQAGVTAILAVHVWGRPADVESLQRIADEHGLTLLLDAAHALGCTRNGQYVGCSGSGEVFSFHATKFFNTFEGGAITTNDDSVAEACRAMRCFGSSGTQIVSGGTNAKMSEAAAAMGLVNLEYIPAWIERNRQNYESYVAGLSRLPGVRMVEFDPLEATNFQYAVIEVDERDAGLTREELAAALAIENVGTRPYFSPACHELEPYRSRPQSTPRPLPRAEALARRTLSLPTGSSVTPEQAAGVADLITRILADARSVRMEIGRR